MTLEALEQLVRSYGAVEIRYVPANESADPDENMPWTVTLKHPITVWDGENHIEWSDHEHGGDLDETVAALLVQVTRSRGALTEQRISELSDEAERG